MGSDRKEVSKATAYAIQVAGGGAALARKLGLKSRQAVYLWKRVPSHHVIGVERVTGVPRQILRPDLYPEETPTRERESAL
jgi:DNA-binding transcriptional regulator YdaS (Cro superfamily)